MLLAGISLLILVLLMLSGVPVGFAFVGAVVFLIATGGYDPGFLLTYAFQQTAAMVLLALPLFILAGGMMEGGGIAERLINFINVILSRIRGGLGAAGVIVQGIFGAISGSAAAAICAIGPIMIPRLEREGYPRPYASSLITAAASLALLIPPSIYMIIYGWLTYTSISACFLAGLGPGILLAGLFILFNWIMVRRLPTVKRPRPWGNVKQVARETAYSGRHASAALVMPVVVLGSIYGGIATPTEAAALAVVYAMALGFSYRKLTLKVLGRTMIANGATIGVVMILLFGAAMLCRMFTMERIPQTVAAFVLSLSQNKYLILLLVNVFLIFIGMIMADTGALVISVPLLLPLVTQIGISAVHFSAIICINLSMGLMTPPMAPLLYTGVRIGETTLAAMFKTSLLIVVFVFLPAVLVTTYWPPLSEWLPATVLGA